MGNFGVNFALDRSRDRKAEARDIVYTRKEVDSSLAAQDEKIKLLLAKLEEQSREIEELKANLLSRQGFYSEDRSSTARLMICIKAVNKKQ